VAPNIPDKPFARPSVNRLSLVRGDAGVRKPEPRRAAKAAAPMASCPLVHTPDTNRRKVQIFHLKLFYGHRPGWKIG
jgi:hypothetical protein